MKNLEAEKESDEFFRRLISEPVVLLEAKRSRSAAVRYFLILFLFTFYTISLCSNFLCSLENCIIFLFLTV